MKPISLYIHIPFCESKCYYCDFTSFSGANHRVKDYVDALINEMKLIENELKNYYIKTIFIGGGTPSSIEGKYIYKILEYIYTNFNCNKLTETTIEANPGSLSREKVKIYNEAGINRVSVGAQSFDDEILKVIGRIHTSKMIYESVYLLREAGFTNINLDLMSALPNQNMEKHMDSIKKAVDLGIEHISNYSLILEEGTLLYNNYKNGKLNLANDELDREMYHKTVEYLKDKGYIHYEISNYAKPSYESKHNLAYWNIDEYLGLGLGSHSNLNNKRFNNTNNLDKYICNLGKGLMCRENIYEIGKLEKMSEYCIMGFRKIEGINKKDFQELFNENFEETYKPQIEKNVLAGLLKNDRENIYLTKKGLDLMNIVELDFYN